MTALLRAELRKTFSTRLWWALGIPVLVLSVLYNLFGALFAGARRRPGGPARDLVPLLSLAYTMALTSVFAAVAGIVGTAGEFRHHTAAHHLPAHAGPRAGAAGQAGARRAGRGAVRRRRGRGRGARRDARHRPAPPIRRCCSG